MKLLIPTFLVITCASQANAQSEISPVVGETIEQTFSIVEQKIGSRSRDIRDAAVSISVPSGYSIIDVKIDTLSCHYCGIRLDSITQPEELSFDNEIIVSIRDASKSGFLNGAFSFGSDNGSANAAMQYAKFSSYISTNLKFFSATNGIVRFRYSLDSDSYNHGAWIKSQAVVTLAKVPIESDAKLVLDVIRAAAEFQQETDLQELLLAALQQEPSGQQEPAEQQEPAVQQE